MGRKKKEKTHLAVWHSYLHGFNSVSFYVIDAHLLAIHNNSLDAVLNMGAGVNKVISAMRDCLYGH